MKKLIIGLLLICTMFLSGCGYIKRTLFANVISSDLPTAYASSNWTSREPEISFSIDEQDYAFEIFEEKNGHFETLLLGYFVSSDAESFTVSITQDDLFGCEYDEIVFYRQ